MAGVGSGKHYGRSPAGLLARSNKCANRTSVPVTAGYCNRGLQVEFCTKKSLRNEGALSTRFSGFTLNILLNIKLGVFNWKLPGEPQNPPKSNNRSMPANAEPNCTKKTLRSRGALSTRSARLTLNQLLNIKLGVFNWQGDKHGSDRQLPTSAAVPH